MQFKVGQRPKRVMNCCKTLFKNCYNVGNTYINEIVSQIKTDDIIAAGIPTSRSTQDDVHLKSILRLAKEMGMKLSR